MPRASAYSKDPEKYKRAVKARRCKGQFERYGFCIPEVFLSNGQKYDLVNYAEDIKKMARTKTLAKALRTITNEMENKTFYTCDGYSFVPRSVYEKYFTNLKFVLSTYEIGRLRINEWLPILRQAYPYEKGYSVYITPIDKIGVDVLVRKDGMPYLVIELTNYSGGTYISYKDVKRYVKNLNEWDKYRAHKVVVVSYAGNLKHRKKPDLWEDFPKNGICIKVMGNKAR